MRRTLVLLRHLSLSSLLRLDGSLLIAGAYFPLVSYGLSILTRSPLDLWWYPLGSSCAWGNDTLHSVSGWVTLWLRMGLSWALPGEVSAPLVGGPRTGLEVGASLVSGSLGALALMSSVISVTEFLTLPLTIVMTRSRNTQPNFITIGLVLRIPRRSGREW